MREIKFRAWDATANKFIEDYGNTIYVESFGWNSEFYPVQQYTGLKDKNGKEIYEGDYVFCQVNTGIAFFSHLTLEIKWCAGWSCWGAEYSGELFFMNQMHDMEVIGNIYENAELLTHENK